MSEDQNVAADSGNPVDPGQGGDHEVSEQMRVRKDKYDRLREQGREPYAVWFEDRTHTLREVREGWDHLGTGEETRDEVGIGGRVVHIRNTGKLCFAVLQGGFTPDEDAVQLQVMLSKAEVGEESLASWKNDVDLGDFVFVHGRVIRSRRGELSVMADRWEMASKALRPMPTLHHELSEESRVRERYADLVMRPQAREVLRTRAAITRSIRETLHREGYLEVETPILQLIHGGAAARPFETHINAFDRTMSLRIALELHLKRTMVGGADRVYEMGRVFRNEGIDSTHSAEFTMLEAYQSWGDQATIAALIQRIIVDAADVVGTRQVETERGTIDLDGEWPWLDFYTALSEAIGEEITPQSPGRQLHDLYRAGRFEAEIIEADVRAAFGAGEDGGAPQPEEAALVELCESRKDAWALELFGELVEPDLLQPTFVCNYPAAAQPLARQHRTEPGKIEAWDLIIGGMERGTGFSELIDPVIQRERLTSQSLAAAAGDPEAMQLDEEFLAALEFGAPPMGGLGLGVDRLVMLFTNVGIRETILYPLLKPTQ